MIPRALAILRLFLTPGVGPVLAGRLMHAFPDAAALFQATPASLQRIDGIGPARAASIAGGLRASADLAAAELERAAKVGVRLIARGDGEYPPLLGEIPDAPLVLYVRGSLADPRHPHAGRFPVAIVGSRGCTAYGVEQAERFSAILAQSGLTIVSGGARGIDTAAHRAATRVRGCTFAVVGCGLGHCYPPENADLFNQIVEQGGAVISEFPLDTAPAPENFPKRNRVISGLSLGTLVIEAPRASGALITARVANEQSREVFALPGRVDSPASEGSHELIRLGAATLVTTPGEIIEQLESHARHHHFGTHAARFGGADGDGNLFAPQQPAEPAPPPRSGPKTIALTDTQRRLVDALDDARTIDDLVGRTGLPAETLRADATVLEVRGLVVRQGSKLARKG
ncbi:MAG: DNA-protecting protein DprA [Phycisphaerales bacterium]|nr:DNA-protecting protein DprA [Phycisphaerales bacterium]